MNGTTNITVSTVLADDLTVSGWSVIFSWFLFFFSIFTTTVTMYFLISYGCNKRRPFHNNSWILLAMQAASGYLCATVPLRDIFGSPLCLPSTLATRLGQVLYISPLIILAVWLWFMISTELQKDAVSMGDPKALARFVRKKKIISSWSMMIGVLILILPLILGLILDTNGNKYNEWCNTNIFKLSSTVQSATNSLGSLIPLGVTIYLRCKYKIGSQVVYHIWKNILLIFIFLPILIVFPKNLNFNSGNFGLIMICPFWDIMFVFYPVYKQYAEGAILNTDTRGSKSNSSQSSRYTQDALEKKASINPKRIGMNMFLRLVLSKDGGSAFKEHLEEGFSGELLLFYTAVIDFENDCNLNQMNFILKTYVGDDAPLEVNLPADVVDAIFVRAQKKMLDSNIFSDAKKCVEKLMKSNMDNRFRFSTVAWDQAMEMRRQERQLKGPRKQPKLSELPEGNEECLSDKIEVTPSSSPETAEPKIIVPSFINL